MRAQTPLQLSPMVRIGIATTTGTFEDHGVTQSLGSATFAGLGLRLGKASAAFSVQVHAEATSSSRIHYQSVPPCLACQREGPDVNIVFSGVDVEGLAHPWPATRLRIGVGLGTRAITRIASGCGGLCQPDPTDSALGVWEMNTTLERWSGRHALGLELAIRSGAINGHWVQTTMLSLTAAY